jgi:hypothetical protein
MNLIVALARHKARALRSDGASCFEEKSYAGDEPWEWRFVQRINLFRKEEGKQPWVALCRFPGCVLEVS